MTSCELGAEFETKTDLRKITSPFNGARGGRPSKRVIFERYLIYKSIPREKWADYLEYLEHPYVNEMDEIRADIAEANEYFRDLKQRANTSLLAKPKQPK